jgi:hypothetical protein
MNSEKQKSLPFTPREAEDIEQYGSVCMIIRDLSMMLDVPEDELLEQFRDPHSPLRFHFDKGLIQAKTTLILNILEEAKSGNLNAAILYQKAIHNAQINNLKYEFFGL